MTPGMMVSHFRIVSRLGAGGMGEVYLAQDTRLDRSVALKTLPADLALDPERKKRLVQEAKTASALNHPNIVSIYEIDTATVEGRPVDFIAMEYVAGRTLEQAIGPRGLELREALRYAVQIADALAKAHAAGIVHRDLKPSNLMVTDDGLVKVLDFGLAKLSEPADDDPLAPTRTLEAAPRTAEGTIIGTVAYMSPEQAEGKKLDARSDIFSFGSVLYEMLIGRRPFRGETKISTLGAILHKDPAPFPEIGPKELEKIVLRCLRKDPARRFQHMSDVKVLLEDITEETESTVEWAEPRRRSASGRLSVGRWWWLAATAACVVVSLAVAWRLHGPEAEAPTWTLTRLTRDAGLSGFPALSPDGKLVAYSSDRSLDGEPDLYIKQVAGGQPIRLTSDGAGNTTPDFSPDGSKIVFRSNRDGGGIYEIPAFGGEVRLLARDGLNPKFSPDGSQVAYWVGAPSVAASVPGSGSVWVAPVSGGTPQRVGANFTAARNPIWSPDGKRLLFVGYTSAKAYEVSSLDWWLVATNGGDAVRIGVYEALVHAKLRALGDQVSGVPIPGCWSATANGVIFSMAIGDTQNLWEIGVSPTTGKITGVVKRLTTGAGNETYPSCASGGTLTFTNVETRTDVWSLPMELDRGRSKGALERITQGPALRGHASLSNNGRYVAFASNQAGQTNIWIRDLASGKESSVASSSFLQRYPVISASGARVAFSVNEKDKRVVYVSAPGGAPEKLCEGCLRATDWSRDEKTLLMFGGNPYQINVLDVASHQQTPILKHPSYNLLYARFSPDNRWVSFTIRTQPNRARIAIAPLDGPKPVAESAWITIAEVGAEDWANWSPDGMTLYFTSSRDGHYCLWGQRIEASSHQPVGEAFAVQHLHGRVSYRQGGWSAAAGRIAMVLAEDTGNIWMMSRSGAR